MPTSKQQVSCYPNGPLYFRLKQYQREQGLKSLSQAAIQIFEEYFEMIDSSSSEPQRRERAKVVQLRRELAEIRTSFLQQVEEFERKLNQLEEEIENEQR